MNDNLTDTPESPFQSWARRLMVGPMPLLQQEMRGRNEQTQQEYAAQQKAIQDARMAERQQANIMAQIRGQAQANQEAEDRRRLADQQERFNLVRDLVRTRPMPGQGQEPELTPHPLEMLLHKGGLEAYKALNPPQENVLTEHDPTKELVNRQGATIRAAQPPVDPFASLPKPWEGYNPLTIRPSYQQGKWEPTIHMPDRDTLLALKTDLETKAKTPEGLTPKERAGLEQVNANLNERNTFETGLANIKANAQFQYREPSETDRKALEWITTGKNLLARLREFTPDQLSAATGAKGFLQGKVDTAKAMLPEVFGPPSERAQNFQKLEKLLAEFETGAFAKGGLQLTPFEASVVFGTVPTRADMVNPLILKTKMENFQKSLAVGEQVRLRSLNIPRHLLTPTVYDQMLRDAYVAVGVAIPGPKTPPPKSSTAGPGKWAQ